MKYCDTSKLSIRQIDKPTAKKMVVKYHYSKLWTKCSVALGLFIDTGKEHSFFDEPEEKMIGVIVYGDPIGRLTGQSISDEIKRTEVLELTRLFIHDGYGSNIESWFISQSFNWLRKNKSEIKALISYASPVEDIVEQSIKQRIGFIKVITIVGMMVGYLNLKKMVDGYMVELSSLIIKPTTQKKYRNKWTNLFG